MAAEVNPRHWLCARSTYCVAYYAAQYFYPSLKGELGAKRLHVKRISIAGREVRAAGRWQWNKPFRD